MSTLVLFAPSDLLGAPSSPFPADATHLPTFYIPNHWHQYAKSFHARVLVTMGTIFGAIHCTWWNLPFPTHAEQKLWPSLSTTHPCNP